jgi:hypothetical protein
MYTRKQIAAVAEFFAFVFFVVGCAKDVQPLVEPSNVLFTETPPIASEVPTGSATPEPTMTDSAPHVTPYIKVVVESVDIRFLGTDPETVELVIRGTLPDQCTYDFYSIENRSSQEIKISLAGIHPGDTGCERTVQTIEYVMLLGRDLPEAERGLSAGDYKLTVNNYQTSFSIK